MPQPKEAGQVNPELSRKWLDTHFNDSSIDELARLTNTTIRKISNDSVYAKEGVLISLLINYSFLYPASL